MTRAEVQAELNVRFVAGYLSRSEWRAKTDILSQPLPAGSYESVLR